MTLINSSTNRAVLLTIQWVDEDDVTQSEYWTNWTSHLEVDGTTYTSEPSLDVTVPGFDGGWERKSATVSVDSSLSIVRSVGLGRAFPKVSATIQQLSWNPTDLASATALQLWSGDVVTAEINPEGRPGVGKLTVDACGGAIDRQVTPICSNRCWKRFGDAKTCTVDLPSLQETATVSALSNRTLTVSGLTTPTDNYWAGGRVNLSGAEVRIRSWDFSNPTRLELAEYPPQVFVDHFEDPSRTDPVTVVVTPGCDRSLLACQHFNNEPNWGGGIGVAMPLRDPNLDLE